MQPPEPPARHPQPEPITRHYTQDADYSADAARMVDADWEVLSVERQPDNTLIARYAPPTPPPQVEPSALPVQLAQSQTMPPTLPLQEAPAPSTPPHVSRYITDEQQRRSLTTAGWMGAGIVGGLVLLCLIASLLSSALNGAESTTGGQTTGGLSSLSPSARAAGTALTMSSNATATANIAEVATANAQPTPTSPPTPTSAPAPVLISGARLGGPLSDFDAKYGPEASQGMWNTTIAGQQVQLIVSITKVGDSLDGQDRAIIIDITQLSGPAWSSTEDAALVASFLPPDATHVKNLAGWGSLGTDHVYLSQQLASSLDASVFQNAAGQLFTPGTFDWQCSTGVPLCEVAVGTNS